MTARKYLLGITLCIGCGDERGAAPDAAPADTVGADASPCSDSASLFAGTMADFDSSVATPAPVAGVALTVEGGSPSATTDAAGAFALCLETLPSRITFDAPGDYLDGVMYVEASYLRDGAPVRLLTAARASTFYTERGLTFDGDRGHLLALHAFDAAALTLDASHDTAQTTYGSDESFEWVAGMDGRYVLFPNVDVATAEVRLEEAASLDPPELGRRYHDVPVAAGTLTLAIVSLAFGP